MRDITTVGVDLAKEVFAVCVLDQTGAVVHSKVLKRDVFISWAEQLSPCAVAMEACGSAHYWGRWFAARGHTSRLIAAEFVVPFRKGGKNDGADAEAVAIAARQPTTRFVPVKTDSSNCTLRRCCGRRGGDQSSVSPSVRRVLRGSQASTRIRCGYVDAAPR